MKVIVVLKTGCYRHEIAGVASTLEKAVEMACAAIRAERDDYHNYIGVECELDVASPLVNSEVCEGIELFAVHRTTRIYGGPGAKAGGYKHPNPFLSIAFADGSNQRQLLCEALVDTG